MSKTKKIRHLIKAAKMGYAPAMYRLGIEYRLGKRLPQDAEIACFWLTQAAERGHAEAIECLKDYQFDDSADVQAYS